MKEKFSIRYSTKGILLFILILSLLASLLTVSLDLNNLFRRDGDVELDSFMRIYVHNSMYRESFRNPTPESFNENTKGYLKYYLNTEKIINYPMTQEYKDNYPNNLVFRNIHGKYEYFDYADEQNLSDLKAGNTFVANNRENIEEPILGETFLTNDNIFLREYGRDFRFDTSSLTFKEGNAAIIGTWENGKITTKLNSTVSELSAQDERIISSLEKAILNEFDNINPRENGIKKMNFAYTINLAAGNLLDEISDSYNENALYLKLFLTSVIGFLIILVVAFFSSYEEIKEVGLYKGVSEFPIEIVLTLFGIYLAVLTFVADSSYNISRSFNTSPLIIFLIQPIVMFFGAMAIYYFVYGMKDISKNGSKSFVVKKSIFVRIFNYIKNTLFGSLSKFTNGFEGTNKNNILMSYGALLLLGFLGITIVVRYQFQLIMYILWIIFITGIFGIMKKYYDDIKQIEDVSNNIAKGNYGDKVDESKSGFNTLAHNLNTVSDNLDKAVEDAIKSERMKTELITNVSHDLKTPLTSIINYSELIVESDVDETELRNYAQVINEKSHKLKNLIEDLFEVSKVSSQNIELDMDEIDFGQLVEQIIGEWEDKLEEKNLSVNLTIPTEPVILELDGHRTSRILDNIISNIYKYALENTRVYFDLNKNEKVELVIKNISKYPLNISPEELMERFTRGDESRTTEGSGLGLSIASSLVEIQGGEFKIDIDGDLFKTTIRF